MARHQLCIIIIIIIIIIEELTRLLPQDPHIRRAKAYGK